MNTLGESDVDEGIKRVPSDEKLLDNRRSKALRLASERTPRLSQTGLRISRLGSVYRF